MSCSPRPSRSLAVLGLIVLAAVLTGCAHAPATSGTRTATATQQPGSSQGLADRGPVTGPILGAMEVWLGESGIMLWQPVVETPGAYRVEATNHGRHPHDLTILRWEGRPADIPARSGRALLQGLEVLAQSALLQPGDVGALDVNLDRPGRYLVLSAHGTDFGEGMVTTLTVASPLDPSGGASVLAAPEPTPGPEDSDEVVRVYLVDRAIFLSGRLVDSGVVSFLAQNLGPSAHDLVLVRWRGDPHALPVAADGEVLLDSLLVLDRLGTLQAGAEAVLDVELDRGFGYAVFSSLPGDYAAGMVGQVFTR
ncbi:MAG: hypothetical protein M0R73_07575 [Dehalococcoidia bacterium]|nr:hypothetical protein [Dehalococcoidia bacterium]